MTTLQNRQFRLARRPQGSLTREDFRFVTEPPPKPGPGEFVVRNTWLSLDPAMRAWASATPSYIPPVEIDAVMRAFAAGVVVASRHPDWPVGTGAAGLLGMQDFACTDGEGVRRALPGAPLPAMLSILGLHGLTAYFGLLDVGRPRPGETVLVSAAAGAVGSLVIQIARIMGCRPVGIAGGPEKCAQVRALGAEAVDYKAADFHAQLKAACPDGVDVFFDNVGGEILEAALRRLNLHGRVVLCGAISQYNAERPQGPSNYLVLLSKRGRMQGFVYFDYADRFDEAERALATWLERGWLQYREDVVDGLENAPEAIGRLFAGANTGKLLVRVADEGEAERLARAAPNAVEPG